MNDRQIIIGAHGADGFSPKSGRERRIPIHPELWDWLEPVNAYFFPGERGEQFRTDIRRPWMAMLNAAAIPWRATPHTLRHTFGTWLARAGSSAWEIQALMGHASVRTSERYIHLAGNPRLRDAVGALRLPSIEKKVENF